MSSYSGCPLRLFPNGPFTIHGEPSRIRLCRTVPRMFAYLATTWRSRQYLLLTIPESKNASTVIRHFDHDFWQQECENSALRGNLAKFSHEKMRPALVHTVPTPPRRSEPPRQIVGHRPDRVPPREHKRPDSHVRHFGHDLLQKYCEHIVPRGNMATFSQKYEIRLVLGHIGERRLAEACPMINSGALV